ncbi:MAG: hypothetical protein KAY24_20130 [Candidatus Eisenbacteria sp.]|nr:hypothetical protein [Candidatus Eisenbacteria bacterium]
MLSIPRSPSEYYIRYLISRVAPSDIVPDEIMQSLEALGLDGLGLQYIRRLAEEMEDRPEPYCPDDSRDIDTRKFLRTYKIFDMWHPTSEVREARLILLDQFLREKLEPMLLSTLKPQALARKLRKYTSIALTAKGIIAYGHYFWNRGLLSQHQWMEYLDERHTNPYRQSLLISPDVAAKHLPWVMGIAGPDPTFNSMDAAVRIGQIAFKHALELEHKSATLETTSALSNCMRTIEKADAILRRSDVALHEVLAQFQKFRMRTDPAQVAEVQQLTDGNFSKSGEGTDVLGEDEF